LLLIKEPEEILVQHFDSLKKLFINLPNRNNSAVEFQKKLLNTIRQKFCDEIDQFDNNFGEENYLKFRFYSLPHDWAKNLDYVGTSKTRLDEIED
jgi:hypothetical protein